MLEEAGLQGQVGRGTLLLGLVTDVEANMCVIWTLAVLAGGGIDGQHIRAHSGCLSSEDRHGVMGSTVQMLRGVEAGTECPGSGPTAGSSCTMRTGLHGSPSPCGQWAKDVTAKRGRTALFEERGTGRHKLRLPG